MVVDLKLGGNANSRKKPSRSPSSQSKASKGKAASSGRRTFPKIAKAGKVKLPQRLEVSQGAPPGPTRSGPHITKKRPGTVTWKGLKKRTGDVQKKEDPAETARKHQQELRTNLRTKPTATVDQTQSAAEKKRAAPMTIATPGGFKPGHREPPVVGSSHVGPVSRAPVMADPASMKSQKVEYGKEEELKVRRIESKRKEKKIHKPRQRTPPPPMSSYKRKNKPADEPTSGMQLRNRVTPRKRKQKSAQDPSLMPAKRLRPHLGSAKKEAEKSRHGMKADKGLWKRMRAKKETRSKPLQSSKAPVRLASKRTLSKPPSIRSKTQSHLDAMDKSYRTENKKTHASIINRKSTVSSASGGKIVTARTQSGRLKTSKPNEGSSAPPARSASSTAGSPPPQSSQINSGSMQSSPSQLTGKKKSPLRSNSKTGNSTLGAKSDASPREKTSGTKSPATGPTAVSPRAASSQKPLGPVSHHWETPSNVPATNRVSPPSSKRKSPGRSVSDQGTKIKRPSRGLPSSNGSPTSGSAFRSGSTKKSPPASSETKSPPASSDTKTPVASKPVKSGAKSTLGRTGIGKSGKGTFKPNAPTTTGKVGSTSQKTPSGSKKTATGISSGQGPVSTTASPGATSGGPASKSRAKSAPLSSDKPKSTARKAKSPVTVEIAVRKGPRSGQSPARKKPIGKEGPKKKPKKGKKAQKKGPAKKGGKGKKKGKGPKKGAGKKKGGRKAKGRKPKKAQRKRTTRRTPKDAIMSIRVIM